MKELRYIFNRLRATRVLENYSFMTALTVLNSLIAILIYPYLIRVLGKEQMGLYVFLFAVVSYLQVLVDYGFDQPATKAVAEAAGDKEKLSFILSHIQFAKFANLLFSLLLFVPFVMFIPVLKENILLIAAIVPLLFVPIFFPSWYFQGTKNMKVVTYINLCYRLLQVPFVFIFVHSPEHTCRYAFLVSFTMLAGAIAAFVYIWRQGLRPVKISREAFITNYKDATPFFLTHLASNIKDKVLTNFVGVAFGMSEVAIYDLACKIVQVPRLFTQNINAALFPEVITDPAPERVKKILRYERLAGGLFAVLVSLLAYPAVLLLGGRDMMTAVPLTVVLSLTIYSWLVVGAYLQFVFIPAHRYSYITYNQLVALFSCFLFCTVGYVLFRSVAVVAVALTLSGFAEILFCRYLTRKHSLL